MDKCCFGIANNEGYTQNNNSLKESINYVTYIKCNKLVQEKAKELEAIYEKDPKYIKVFELVDKRENLQKQIQDIEKEIYSITNKHFGIISKHDIISDTSGLSRIDESLRYIISCLVDIEMNTPGNTPHGIVNIVENKIKEELSSI